MSQETDRGPRDQKASDAFARWRSFSIFAFGLALLVTVLGINGSGQNLADRSGYGAIQIASAESPEARRFRFDYEVKIPAREAAASPMHIFLPLAANTHAQRILDLEIDSPVPGKIEEEPKYGNAFWHALLPADSTEAFSVKISYEVKRHISRAGAEAGSSAQAARFLTANDRVVVGHSVLDPILKEIRSASPGASPSERARAIYDWVVDNVEYKKTGTGWGNGDTFWACNERYGNCTDFHSLFISLARTEGIPARFEIGFPVPTDRESGEISGYHCWVEFWLPEAGWVPIDASEASKDPAKRELFYGLHPADRLHFSTGRDLRLGENHKGRALNYFIYPYIEIAGKRSRLEVETRFRYEDRPRFSSPLAQR